MNERQIPSSLERFPILFLTVAMLLTGTVLGWFGWNTYQSYRTARIVRERYFRMQVLQGVITHLDEVLTMSAHMAAATGNLAWEQRYRQFEPKLDDAIKEVIKLEPNAFSGEGAAATEAANIKLVEMEHRAFDLVRQNRQADAREVLFSTLYEEEKRIYSQGMLKTAAVLDKETSDGLKSEQQRSVVNIISIAIALPTLLIGWLIVLRTLRSWRLRLSASNQYLDQQTQALRALNIDLDKRVMERTAQLEAAHLVDLIQKEVVARLAELVDNLQSCQNVDEAFKITASTLQGMWPSTVGAVYIISPSRDVVEMVASWGKGLGNETAFHPDECWALRRGKVHQVKDSSSPLQCAHVSKSMSNGYVCVQLAAQNETLGMLYVEDRSEASISSVEPRPDRVEILVQQATAVGERISLALANLRLREVLRGQSIRDPLTGLFNRRFMEESLARELRRAVRSQMPVVLLMLDIDHFKHFNDTFGHQAGDALLRALGNLLKETTRGQDVACRYGGEEFAIVLAGAPLDAARVRAELLGEEIKQLNVRHDGQLLGAVTLSMGIAVFPDNGDSAESLLKAADDALYRAKKEGRNRIVLAQGLTQFHPIGADERS